MLKALMVFHRRFGILWFKQICFPHVENPVENVNKSVKEPFFSGAEQYVVVTLSNHRGDSSPAAQALNDSNI